jgi:hypothetical protein
MSKLVITPAAMAMAQTGRTVELGNNRTLEMFVKYGVWYAIIETPFGVEYYGPLEDLEYTDVFPTVWDYI